MPEISVMAEALEQVVALLAEVLESVAEVMEALVLEPEV
jgi:hypothetical protein